MTTLFVRVVVLGSAAVLVFDLLASLASRHFGFPYARAALGSYLLYLAIGFFAARVSTWNAIAAAAGAAGISGLIDASLGWAISWALGPGKLPQGVQLTVPRWVNTAVFVVAFAAAIGAIGGFVGRKAASTQAAV